MYSNRQQEQGADSDENLTIFFDKLPKATEKLKTNFDLDKLTLRPLFRSHQAEFKIENWIFKFINESSELHVTNMFADQTTIFRPSATVTFR
jgi:hypothetical protein